MEGISHSINKTQLVKTLQSPIQAQEDALTAQSLAKILWWLILGSLTAQVPPHTHTQLPSLAWGQPSNQIQTIVRCSLNQEAKEIRKQRVQRPQKNKKTPENTESYTLKLTCTGYSGNPQGTWSRKGKGPPTPPQTQKRHKEDWASAPAPGEGPSRLAAALWYSGGKNPAQTQNQRSLQSPRRGLPGWPEYKGEGGCADHMARAPRAQGRRVGSVSCKIAG